MARKFFDFLVTITILFAIAVLLSIPIVRIILFLLTAGIIGIGFFIYGLKEFLKLKLIKGSFIMLWGVAVIRGLLIMWQYWF